MTASHGADTRQVAAYLEDVPDAMIGVGRSNAIMLVNAVSRF